MSKWHTHVDLLLGGHTSTKLPHMLLLCLSEDNTEDLKKNKRPFPRPPDMYISTGTHLPCSSTTWKTYITAAGPGNFHMVGRPKNIYGKTQAAVASSSSRTCEHAPRRRHDKAGVSVVWIIAKQGWSLDTTDSLTNSVIIPQVTAVFICHSWRLCTVAGGFIPLISAWETLEHDSTEDGNSRQTNARERR